MNASAVFVLFVQRLADAFAVGDDGVSVNRLAGRVGGSTSRKRVAGNRLFPMRFARGMGVVAATATREHEKFVARRHGCFGFKGAASAGIVGPEKAVGGDIGNYVVKAPRSDGGKNRERPARVFAVADDVLAGDSLGGGDGGVVNLAASRRRCLRAMFGRAIRNRRKLRARRNIPGSRVHDAGFRLADVVAGIARAGCRAVFAVARPPRNIIIVVRRRGESRRLGSRKIGRGAFGHFRSGDGRDDRSVVRSRNRNRPPQQDAWLGSDSAPVGIGPAPRGALRGEPGGVVGIGIVVGALSGNVRPAAGCGSELFSAAADFAVEQAAGGFVVAVRVVVKGNIAAPDAGSRESHVPCGGEAVSGVGEDVVFPGVRNAQVAAAGNGNQGASASGQGVARNPLRFVGGTGGMDVVAKPPGVAGENAVAVRDFGVRGVAVPEVAVSGERALIGGFGDGGDSAGNVRVRSGGRQRGQGSARVGAVVADVGAGDSRGVRVRRVLAVVAVVSAAGRDAGAKGLPRVVFSARFLPAAAKRHKAPRDGRVQRRVVCGKVRGAVAVGVGEDVGASGAESANFPRRAAIVGRNAASRPGGVQFPPRRLAGVCNGDAGGENAGAGAVRVSGSGRCAGGTGFAGGRRLLRPAKRRAVFHRGKHRARRDVGIARTNSATLRGGGLAVFAGGGAHRSRRRVRRAGSRPARHIKPDGGRRDENHPRLPRDCFAVPQRNAEQFRRNRPPVRLQKPNRPRVRPARPARRFRPRERRSERENGASRRPRESGNERPGAQDARKAGHVLPLRLTARVKHRGTIYHNTTNSRKKTAFLQPDTK